MSPFTRDGHLSDLGLELLQAGELEASALDAARGHLAGCASCRGRESALRDDAALAPPPRVRRAANRAFVLAVALAAAVLLAIAVASLAPGTESDGWRVRGARLQLEVYVDEGPRSRRVRSGDSVRPGDRLGFRVRSGEEGEVMVVGVDETGSAYLCWPRSGSSEAVAPADVAADLSAAVRLDERPGIERLVVLRCDRPFSFDEVAPALAEGAVGAEPGTALAPLREGCAQGEVDLVKVAP